MTSASAGFHEPLESLSKRTRDLHRALVSLQEELEAIDWYRQRADACGDGELRAVLMHNLTEEVEHASMLLEWLRRHDENFELHLKTYLFTDAPITEVEQQESNGEEGSGKGERWRAPAHTIGSLKEG